MVMKYFLKDIYMSKNKILVIFLIVIASILCLYVLYKFNYGVKIISDITPIRNNNVTKIVFTNGHNGNQNTITDKEKINEYITYLQNFRFKKDLNQKCPSGFGYAANIYTENSITNIIVQSDIVINSTQYSYTQINKNVAFPTIPCLDEK